MRIQVEIEETYKGSQWYRLVIHLPGYGTDHPGFFLLPNTQEAREAAHVVTPEGPQLFRPEYAKEIKRRLET